MEGWDATAGGRPTDLVERRWRRFGESGAALIWGGEAVAVQAAGRANPNQLCVDPDTGDAATSADLAGLREGLASAWSDTTGTADGLVVGLQLTHSGRFARPHGAPAPRIAYYMSGVGGNTALIVPTHDLVVVRMGHYRGQAPVERALREAVRLLLEAVPPT